jgi:hypothetical protein
MGRSRSGYKRGGGQAISSGAVGELPPELGVSPVVPSPGSRWQLPRDAVGCGRALGLTPQPLDLGSAITELG